MCRKTIFILACCLVFLPLNAYSQTSVKDCSRKARTQKKICVNDCVIEKIDALLSCRAPDNACGDACKAAWRACVEPIEANREVCFEACDTTYEDARQACGQQCQCTPGQNCGNNECFGSCTDPHAIDRATCKATCRRADRGDRIQCRKIFKACTKPCKKQD